MASKTSLPEPEGTPLDMAQLGRDLARRRAETGIADLPRNPGKHRTPGKRALRKAIKDVRGSG